MRCGSQIFSRGGAMNVRNIRADGEMNRDGDFRAIRGGENALVEMFRVDICARQELPGGFAEADTSAFRQGGHFVERTAGLLGHAEFSFAENGFDIFGRATNHGDFEIVDERGAVHGDSADEAAAKRSTSRGPRPTLMTCPPMPQRIARDCERASTMARTTRRRSSAARMRGSESRNSAKDAPWRCGLAN